MPGEALAQIPLQQLLVYRYNGSVNSGGYIGGGGQVGQVGYNYCGRDLFVLRR